MKRALLILSLLVTAAGCASSQAAAPTAPEGLHVPPVPPRVIAPLPTVEPPEIEPVEHLPEKPPPEAPRRPANRPAPQPQAQPKPETPPETPPEAPVQAPPAPAAPPLRPADSGDGPKAESEVRIILRRTDDMLQSIDYRNLSKERQVNYDAAKNFIKQAEDTLKTGNVVLARSFAERAENYAKAVGGR